MAIAGETHSVCPVSHARSLDNRIRGWLQNPRTILSPFVQQGMTVLDLGCGPGFFTVELARMVGPTGKVIAADLQDGMLQMLSVKIRGTDLHERVRLVKSDAASINVFEAVDFVLAFWMVHEVPDKASLFAQLKALAKQTTQLLVVEPKFFHVSRREFEQEMKIARDAGFVVARGPRLPLAWSALLTGR